MVYHSFTSKWQALGFVEERCATVFLGCLESVSIHTRLHTSPCRYIHPAFMKTIPAKDKTRPRDHAQAGLVRPNRGCPVPSSKASPLGPKLATNTVRSPVRLGVLLSDEHGMGRCWEDSPERTGIAPCVTVPVKTTAVPAGACTVSVGGTAWARGNAVRATASAVAAAVVIDVARRGGPRGPLACAPCVLLGQGPCRGWCKGRATHAVRPLF